MQLADLRIEQPREFAVIEMTGGHEPEALRFLLIRNVRYLEEVPDHSPDQFDKGRGRRFLPEQMR